MKRRGEGSKITTSAIVCFAYTGRYIRLYRPAVVLIRIKANLSRCKLEFGGDTRTVQKKKKKEKKTKKPASLTFI